MGKALRLLDGQTGQRIVVEMGGILVHVGLAANADYLPEIFVIIRQCKFRQQQADGATAALSPGKYLGGR